MGGTIVSILGFGRFGRALAELVARAGFGVRAFDPRSEVPKPIRCDDPHDLVRGADIVVLAVPVSAIPRVLEDLSTHLNSRHFVIDVASVKVTPTVHLHSILGSRVPWIATHPLFGPSSLALEERPWRVVVCPNSDHPGAVQRARSFYESMGCEVVEQDAEEHDRELARTHALAFFIAKAMIDIGADTPALSNPPSFRALARTIESVRSDAGHLFAAIQQANPFAAEARRALLDALGRIHEDLAKPEAPARSLDIPDLGQNAPELRETRELIDDVDHELLSLLARRTQLSRRAGRIKSNQGRPIRDPGRERELKAERRAWARELGLDEDSVLAIFEAVLNSSRAVQQRPETPGP